MPTTPRWLYLDDWRPAPDGWYPVRTPEDFRYLLTRFEWDIVSLDNDLSGMRATETGEDLLHWMFESGHLPVQKPRVHSKDELAAPRMVRYIEQHWPRG
ncbi:cyclic-phosphate processing receiver domain-containing protein [Luteitalea sp.]|jgi:hypothetical protein|uniref:cyclic-phosphate processing receiver domain-containing protein n=1 Tax=Luteitalea sp. TaxID=2004800 RepID=UPI0037CCB51B